MTTLPDIAKPYQELWNSPTWYQAATMIERMHALRTVPNDTPLQTTSSREEAERRLQCWKERSPLNTDASFALRLTTNSMSEGDLLALLAEPAANWQKRMSGSHFSAWLQELMHAFEDEDAYHDFSLPPQQIRGSQAKTSLLHPIKPLLKRGIARLDVGMRELARQSHSLPFDPDTIIDLLFASLSTSLRAKLARTLVLEMHIARLQERLCGNTPEERFENFLQQLSQKDEMLSILQEYPVLARQLVRAIDLWVSSSLGFVRHLCRDWKEICDTFTPEHDPGILTEVDGGVGDVHRGGRSVLKLTFRSGFQLIYKPKSLAIDIHFQELLAWLNTHGQIPAFRTLRLLDKGTYGWSECVRVHDCTTAEAVGRFYERQGSYLALLYALEATDFHAENLIADEEHPLLIDLEALFHPRINDDLLTFPAYAAFQSIGYSVLRVGLLPQPIWLSNNADGVDLSGLGGRKGQLSPHSIPHWKEVGTDQMRLVRERIGMLDGQNQPKLDGRDINLLNYTSNITTGFAKMYRLLMEHRDELLTQVLPRFAHDEIRLVLRPTTTYGMLLSESFHPSLLCDALERERLFDRLWVHVEQQPHLQKVIAAEVGDLLNGDIPMFTSRPDCRDCFTSQGEPITDFCPESSLESVKKRIQQLDERDLDRQLWVIQASLATLLTDSDQVMTNRLPLKPLQTHVSRERLLEAACAVGDRICDLAWNSEHGVSWLGIVPIQDRGWGLFPADGSLYNGTPGIVFFLSYLGALTGKMEYTTLAKLAVLTVRQQVEQLKKNLDVVALGAFEGLGSPIYLFSHLGALWNEPKFFLEAEEIAKLLQTRIEKDERFDMIAGSAGCIASLLSLYSVMPSRQTLMTAIACGNHLIDHAQPMPEGVGWTTLPGLRPLAGFSHGAAGIAFSLFKLAEASGEERFRQTATAALAYERSLFSPERQNWADLRNLTHLHHNETESVGYMTAWCHGAPGIGLGRLGSLPYLDNTMIREEIEIAVKTTLATGFGWNQSLCHGDLGNLETLLISTQLLDAPQYRQQLESITAMLLDSIDEHGWVTSVPQGVETPGLMTGLAGIGHELLRLAEPISIPSVLLVAPPYDG